MSTARATRPRPTILPILAVNFVGTLGYSIVLPFLVFVVTRLGGNALVYGVIGATYSAFQLIGAPLLGRWSDRVGRKKVLLVSQLGTLVSWAVFLVALALPTTVLASIDTPTAGQLTLTLPILVLFLARALDGLTGGNVSVANAYLADITSDEDRSTNFGRMSVSSNLGFVLGPALAGGLGGTAAGESLPVIAAMVISAVAAVMIATSLRDPSPCVLTIRPEEATVRGVLGGDQKECYRLQGAGRPALSEVLALPDMKLLLSLQLLIFLAFNLYYVAFPVYTATGLGWSLPEIGVYFAVMGLAMALVQGPLLARLSSRTGDRPLVVGGSLLLAASFPFFSSTSTAVIYLGTGVLALGNGLMWPSLLAITSRSAQSDLQGAVQGLSGSIAAGASIGGLLLGGSLYQVIGPRVFVVSAAVAAVVWLLSLRIGTSGE